MTWYRWDGPDLILELLVQPRASTNAFAGVIGEGANGASMHRAPRLGPIGDRLKVRTTAPPVEGEANQRLIVWLAGQFGVARSAVVICQGTAGRRKRVRIAAPAEIPPELPIVR